MRITERTNWFDWKRKTWSGRSGIWSLKKTYVQEMSECGLIYMDLLSGVLPLRVLGLARMQRNCTRFGWGRTTGGPTHPRSWWWRMQTTWTGPWATEGLSKRLGPKPYPIERRTPTPIGRAGEERATSEIVMSLVKFWGKVRLMFQHSM